MRDLVPTIDRGAPSRACNLPIRNGRQIDPFSDDFQSRLFRRVCLVKVGRKKCEICRCGPHFLSCGALCYATTSSADNFFWYENVSKNGGFWGGCCHRDLFSPPLTPLKKVWVASFYPLLHKLLLVFLLLRVQPILYLAYRSIRCWYAVDTAHFLKKNNIIIFDATHSYLRTSFHKRCAIVSTINDLSLKVCWDTSNNISSVKYRVHT